MWSVGADGDLPAGLRDSTVDYVWGIFLVSWKLSSVKARKLGFLVSPRYGLAFDPAFESFVTFMSESRLITWMALRQRAGPASAIGQQEAN